MISHSLSFARSQEDSRVLKTKSIAFIMLIMGVLQLLKIIYTFLHGAR